MQLRSLVKALSIFALSLPWACAMAQAQYPERPVRVLVGFAAGGSTDASARKLSNKLQTLLGQTFIVENKPGASATIAVAEVAKSRPDGYTLYFGDSAAFLITTMTIPALTYDVRRDFTPIAMIADDLLAIAVHPSVPANNLQQLAALIKANPGKYSFGHSGAGNIGHLTGEMFKMQSGSPGLIGVSYKGAGPAVSDAVAGHVPVVVSGLGSVYQHHQAGRLRLLAIAAKKRASFASDIPAAVEAGYPDLFATATQTLFAPAGTPANVIDALAKAVDRIMSDEAFLAELRQLSVDPVARSTPASAQDMIRTELVKWTGVVKASGFKAE
jgi:tripartite-type tricarboxylate transporter receptor subunit TctC